jgi:hypothetical protein
MVEDKMDVEWSWRKQFETEADLAWRWRYAALAQACRRLVTVATEDSVAFFRTLAEIRGMVMGRDRGDDDGEA